MNTFLPFQWMWDEANQNGIEFINGVMIIHNPQHETHALEVLSKIGTLFHQNLFAMYENDGCLLMVWKKGSGPLVEMDTLELSNTGFIVDTYVIIPKEKK